MASLFEFDTTETLASIVYAKSPAAVAKMKAAPSSKKIPKSHVDKFVAEYGKTKSIQSAVSTAQEYIQKNMVAKKLAPVTANPNILQKAFMVAL